MKKKAFTLIELLVVITIIALLVSILMPALSKAKKQAKDIVCRSNLSQLSKAIALYSAENNDKLFSFDYSRDHWFRRIAYIFGDKKYRDDPSIDEMDGIMKVAQCPSTKVVELPDGDQELTESNKWDEMWAVNAEAYAGGATTQGTMYGSYSINCWLLPDPKDYYTVFSGTNYGANKAKYYSVLSKAKSNVPAFFDCFRFDAWPEDDSSVPNAEQTLNGQYSRAGGTDYSMHRVCVDRHDKAINIGFVDGHVEKVPLEDLWQFKWNRKFQTQNKVNIYH